MEEKYLIDWIRLIGAENIGPSTFRHLLKRYGSADEALKALPEIVKRGGKQTIRVPDIEFAKEQIQQAKQHSALILTWDDPEYPSYLKVIDSAPPVLYLKGNPKLLFNQIFGIVGSRNASLNGIKFTRDLSESLGRTGLSIVSGLAVGIDAAAHQGALETGTIAVLGGGGGCRISQRECQLAKSYRGSRIINLRVSFWDSPYSTSFSATQSYYSRVVNRCLGC